jgi:hypothetical protein
MSGYLPAIGVHAINVCGRTSRGARLEAWNPFILDEVEACTATKAAMRGLLTLKPVILAYSEVPRDYDIDVMHGDVLLFFRADGDLEMLRRLRMVPEMIG